MRVWFNNLVRWIPHQDKAYRSLIERGYFTNRQHTIASTVVQAFDLTDGNIDCHSFSSPAPKVYVQNAAAHAAAIARTNLENATAAAAANAPAPAPVTVPTYPAQVPNSIAVYVSRSVIEAKRSELCDTILSTVPDNDKAESLRAICQGDGCELLRYIYSESAKVSVKVSGAIDQEMLNLFKNGLAEPSLACFNRWKRDYKSWNDANTSNVLPDTILAARYAAVVRKLGGKVETDLDTEIKINQAQGDLAKTIACIETVLTDREADEVTQGRGEALKANFDPRKSDKPKPTEWTPDLRLCRNHDLVRSSVATEST